MVRFSIIKLSVKLYFSHLHDGKQHPNNVHVKSKSDLWKAEPNSRNIKGLWIKTIGNRWIDIKLNMG